MNIQKKFKRYEYKYLISKKTQKVILSNIKNYMTPDEYGKSTLCNLYYDTDTDILIKRSLQSPIYKEKLRVRSYNVATHEDDVFVELKKKYKGIVYKRRISMPEKSAMNYLQNNHLNNVNSKNNHTTNSQITSEIDYFLNFYNSLLPKMFLSYDREAYFASDDYDLRMTFDSNILWRTYDLSLSTGIYGDKLIDDDMVLMEIKTSKAIPLWLSQVLTENKVFKTKFSKYGKAYMINTANKNNKEIISRNTEKNTIEYIKEGA